MIDVCIQFTFGEAQTSEISINLGVPSIGCLFKTVKFSLDSAHMILSIKCLKNF